MIHSCLFIPSAPLKTGMGPDSVIPAGMTVSSRHIGITMNFSLGSCVIEVPFNKLAANQVERFFVADIVYRSVKIRQAAKLFLISKMLQLAPSYWQGCQYPVTWM